MEASRRNQSIVTNLIDRALPRRRRRRRGVASTLARALARAHAPTARAFVAIASFARIERRVD